MTGLLNPRLYDDEEQVDTWLAVLLCFLRSVTLYALQIISLLCFNSKCLDSALWLVRAEGYLPRA